MRPSTLKTVVATTIATLLIPLGGASAAAADPVEPDGRLVAHYALDEETGTVAVDSSGKGHDASFVGGAVLGGDAGVTLDGVDDYVALPADLLAGLDSVTVSLEVLLRPDQASPYFLFGLGNPASSGAGTGYLFATGNALRAGITTTNWQGEQVVNSGSDLERGVWKTVSYTLDDATDTARLYLDGAQIAEQTGVTVKPSEIGAGATSENAIGRSVYAADRYLAGSVRDFRLYGAALGGDEIAALQPSDETRVARDREQVTLGDLSAITDDIALPATGINGSAISWESSVPDVVSSTGEVTRPAAGEPDASVTLTATLTRGSATSTKDFDVTVLAAPTAQSDVDDAAAALAIPNLDDVRGNLTLPGAPSGMEIEWVSSAPAVISTDGVVTRATEDTTVTLTATLRNGDTTAVREFSATVRAAVALPDYEGYTFAYFTGNSTAGENIYFAASEGNNALAWKELNGGRPVLTSSEGTKGLRDPFLIRSPEGDTFYLIATDLSIGSGTSWGDSVRTGSHYLEVWESDDLVNWTDQRHIKVAPDNAGNTWAPEAYYDESIGAYVVFWASSLYADDDVNHTGASYHRMMYATTRDFVTFSEPQIWQDDNGLSRIDSTVIKSGDTYHRFTKDEGGSGTGCSDIIQETSTELRAPLDSWTIVDSCIGRDAGTSAVEGPTAFAANPGDVNGDKFYLFVDEYGGRGYIPLETDDIANPDWTVASDYDLPTSPRHGTVLPVTAAELDLLQKSLDTSPEPVPANEDGEIVRYDFAGSTGETLADVSGNGLDASVRGGAAFSDGALTLDGTDDFVQLPNDLLAGVEDITVETEVWIDPTQANPYFIYGIGNTLGGAGNGYLFSTGNAYRTSLATGNWATEQTVTQGKDLVRGRWAHLTYTLQGTTATLYLDGVQVATGSVTSEPGDIGGGSTSANYLGRSNYDADNRLKGSFREFAIYNRALSATEVLAASGNTGALTGIGLEEDVLKIAPIVDNDARVVTFPVKPGTDVSALSPVYTTATGVVASPASGTTRDLGSPATVTLTPQTGDPVTWTLRAVEMRSPVIPGLYADPNVFVWGDTYYIYATTDGFPGWGGKEFYVWSSKDLVDWERSGEPILTLDGADGDVPWATGNAWAPTIAEKDGKFFFYFSGHNASVDRKTIGVAVADSPTGPFAAQEDAMILNDEAVTSGQAIDPATFTDPVSGKNYLFWGNGSPVYAELSDDMLSIKEDTLKRIDGLNDFREGSFVNYRDGLYHLTYSIDDTGSENYRVGYATSTSIDGPWTYRGVILEKRPELGILATGHNSILNVPGTDDWYIVYHRFAIPGGDGQHRETTIDRLTFDPATGLMNPVTPTLESVGPQRIVDQTPVTIAASISGAAENAAGWRTGSADVTITVTGEATAEYRVGSEAWTAYQGPVTVSAEGTTRVEYRAVRDGEPVDGAAGSATVKIDATAPVSTLVADPEDATSKSGEPVRVSASASDAGSGVAAVQYRLGDGEWAAFPSEGLVFDKPGATVVSYRSIDVAGNVETSRSLVVTVAGTGEPGSLSIDDGSVRAGESFTVRGSGFAPGERVEFTLFSTPTYLGDLVADPSGAFVGTLRVPTATDPGAHTLRAAGAQSGTLAEAELTVLAAAPAPGTDPAPGSGSGSGGPLAVTGGSVGGAILVAGLLLAAGWWLVRRRRSVSSTS
jgi:beta-xylosidase